MIEPSPDPLLYKGWTDPLLREGLRLAPDTARQIFGFIAREGSCTTLEVAEGLGLRSGKTVSTYLQQFSRATAELNVRGEDGKYHWPLRYGERRGGQDVYVMPDEVRAVVLDELGA
jgi:hypothetical protein